MNLLEKIKGVISSRERTIASRKKRDQRNKTKAAETWLSLMRQFDLVANLPAKPIPRSDKTSFTVSDWIRPRPERMEFMIHRPGDFAPFYIMVASDDHYAGRCYYCRGRNTFNERAYRLNQTLNFMAEAVADVILIER